MLECPICIEGFIGRKMFTEPVQRTDGVIMEIHLYHPVHDLVILTDGFGVTYRLDEVQALGDGDFQRGVNLIGETTYKTDKAILQSFAPRVLNKEIKEKTNRFRPQ